MQGLVHTCTTSRAQAIGTNGRKGYQANLKTTSCLFLPMSAYSAIQNGYTVGSAYHVYFSDGTDVQVTDKLLFNGQTYIVRGREAFTSIPVVSHLKIASVTENAHV
jgi:hypothetical protein